MLIRETFVNRTENYLFGEGEPYEPFTDNIGRLFRSLSKEYGRCTGRMYYERKQGGDVPIGWVFEKRMRYEDANKYYIREVWVSLHDAPDTVTREAHYHELGGRP